MSQRKGIILTERYRMVERRLPIFASPRARTGRYYISDNFLRSWLMALQRPVSMLQIMMHGCKSGYCIYAKNLFLNHNWTTKIHGTLLNVTDNRFC